MKQDEEKDKGKTDFCFSPRGKFNLTFDAIQELLETREKLTPEHNT